MKNKILPILLLLGGGLFADIAVKQAPYELIFSDAGELAALKKAGETVLSDGLTFEIEFADGKRLASTETKLVKAESKSDNELLLVFNHELADVELTVRIADGRIEFNPVVTGKYLPVAFFGAPRRFLFPVGDDNRVYLTGMLGLELLPQYFRKQTLENAIFGDKAKIAEAGLREVIPEAKIGFEAAEEIPVLTGAGREWLGRDLALSWKLPVVRPSIDDRHIPLLKTSNGSAAAVYPLGKGAFLRMGSRPAGLDLSYAYHAILGAVLEKVAAGRDTGFKVGRVTGALGNQGMDSRRNQFVATLGRVSDETGKPLTDSLLRTWPDLEEALRDPAGHPVIVNFLYETMPVRSREDWKKSAALIRQYVENGGVWIELAGGYTFYHAAAPQEWNGGAHSLHVDGGQGYSDFLMKAGSLPFSVYGVKLFPEPEVGKKLAPDEYPVATSYGVSPYAAGVGLYSRRYEGWGAVNQPHRFPPTVIRLGGGLRDDYLAYGKENRITRTLTEKVPPSLLESWKKSLFLKINDKTSPIREWTAFVEKVELPGPVLYHHADWTHQDGHFDEYYPDYFPLDRKFGDKAELKRFYDMVKSRGSLVMAYMNPVFWDGRLAKMTDRPVVEYGMKLAGIKERTPEAMRDFMTSLGIIKNRDGKVKAEWGGRLIDMSPWNSVMIAMNHKVYDTFINELGSSIYFHDSVGAERYKNDFGPNAPYPSSHLYGLMAMTNDQRKRSAAPLATEGGADLFLNYYSMFCGVNHYLMPTGWNVYVPWLERYALGSVRPFPFSQFLSHDKAVFIGHNLGNSVFCRDGLTWYLLGGYQLQYSTDLKRAAKDLAGEESWIRTLSSIQAAVGPEMIGEVMTRCEYIEPGVLETEYANGLTVTGNLQRQPYRNIAPYGFLVSKGGKPLAGIILREGREYWFAMLDGREVELKPPAAAARFEPTVEPSARTTKTPLELNPPPAAGMLKFPAGVAAPVHYFNFESLDGVTLTGDGRLEPGRAGKSALRPMYSGKETSFAAVPVGAWLNGRTSWAIGFWIDMLNFSDWRDAVSFGDGRFRLEVDARKNWVIYDSGLRQMIGLKIPVEKNQWRFFLFNSDGRHFSVWSGVDRLERICSEPVPVNGGIRASEELILGARNRKGEGPVFCRIDELAIWGEGLSEAAIHAVFEAGKAGKSLE